MTPFLSSILLFQWYFAMQAAVKSLFCVVVGFIVLATQLQAQKGSFKEFVRHKTRWSKEDIERAMRDRVVQGAGRKHDRNRCCGGLGRSNRATREYHGYLSAHEVRSHPG